MPRIIIIGGGISGLATCHYLKKEVPEAELTLFESQKRLGGTLGSERVDGYVFERGANSFLTNHPETLDLAIELGLEDRLVAPTPEAKTRYLLKNGKLHPLPTSPISFLKTPLLTLKGRLRILAEPFQSSESAEEDDSVASFGRRRLGEEAMRTFLDPLVTGIYGGDVERLSMRSAFPQVAELETEFGSLLKGMIKKRFRKRTETNKKSPDSEQSKAERPKRQLLSFKTGMQELIETLEENLKEHIVYPYKVTRVIPEKNSYTIRDRDGNEEKADAVVLAIPSYRAASMLAVNDPETSQAFESIPYAPIAVACLGFPKSAVKHPLDGFGFLIPRDQGRRLLGSIWVSSIYPEHAPEGHVNLRCMIGGARDPDILNHSDESLQEIVLDDLKPILGIEAEPTISRIYRYAKGIPQYNLGHLDRIERIERKLWNSPGLFITGNAYYGIGLNDCCREAKKRAVAVREYLKTV